MNDFENEGDDWDPDNFDWDAFEAEEEALKRAEEDRFLAMPPIRQFYELGLRQLQYQLIEESTAIGDDGELRLIPVDIKKGKAKLRSKCRRKFGKNWEVYIDKSANEIIKMVDDGSYEM